MRHQKLNHYLSTIIKQRGPIPFREFMEIVLYAPDLGYYTSHGPRVGREGDFITSPEISPIFGDLLAQQLAEMWRKLSQPSVFQIIEFGPGRGLLAHSILQALKDSPLARCLIYHLVEISPHLRRQQQEALASLSNYHVYENPSLAQAGSYGWLPPERLPHDLTGCVLTNEFLDALPIHRIIKKDSIIEELYVNIDTPEGYFRWVTGPLSDPRLLPWYERHIAGQGMEMEDGQITEINLAATDWLQVIDQHLAKGFIVTIDYGHPAKLLYDPSRRNGTLMCYYKHQADTNPLLDIGLKDITAHIDFSALQTIGTDLGWENLGLTNQMWFLISLLNPNAFQLKPDMNIEDFRRHQAIKKLLMPGGMGEIFRVLIQSKGISKTNLRGLSQLPST